MGVVEYVDAILYFYCKAYGVYRRYQLHGNEPLFHLLEEVEIEA